MNIIENKDIKFSARTYNGTILNIQNNPDKYTIYNPDNKKIIISLWNNTLDNTVYNIIVKSNNKNISDDWIYEPSNYFMYNINYNNLQSKKQDDSILEILINKYEARINKYLLCSNLLYKFFYNCFSVKQQILTRFTIINTPNAPKAQPTIQPNAQPFIPAISTINEQHINIQPNNSNINNVDDFEIIDILENTSDMPEHVINIINELDNSIAEYVDNPPNPLNCKTLDNYVIDLPSEVPRELP
jgi:hypothetical protein